MCTVTYLPNPNGNYILTSSRDETIIRSALPPEEYKVHGKNILFPKDPKAGGTWIAYAENRTACLLNGAFHKHISTPPYKKSRGLVLLDYFTYSYILEFINRYDFTGIEPFTLIIIEDSKLFELRWDESKIHIAEQDASIAHIWSSVTLYSEKNIVKRNSWFKIWLSSNIYFSSEAIRQFHKTAGEGDPKNDVLMNRNDILRTVSITTIEKNADTMLFMHEDLLHNSFTTKTLEVV